jgi:guanylate kinase
MAVRGKDFILTTVKVAREQMLEEIEAGNFIESAQFSGNYYGA